MRIKIGKVLSILLAIIMIIGIHTEVFAARTTGTITGGTQTGSQSVTGGGGGSGSQGSGIVKAFDGTSSDTTAGENIITKVIGPILSVVRIIAVGVSIIMISYLGIKYMAAAPSEKANLKNQLVTFTIGAVVVVGTTSILSIIKNFAGETLQ